MKNFLFCFSMAIAIVISMMVLAASCTGSAFGANATEFFMYNQGYLNESMDISFDTRTPVITSDYANSSAGLDKIIFPKNWTGQIKSPDKEGLLTLTLSPMTSNDPEANDRMMKFYNRTKFMPIMTLLIADKHLYKYPQTLINEKLSTPVKDRLTPDQLQFYEQGLKTLASRSGRSLAEVEKYIKFSCQDVEKESTTNIDGKPFQVSFKDCNTPMGPLVQKTYFYEDNDRIYSLSLTGSQIIFMALAPGVQRPNIGQFTPLLDETAGSLKISNTIGK